MGSPPGGDRDPPDAFRAERQRFAKAIEDVDRHVAAAREAVRQADVLLRRIHDRLAKRLRRSPPD